MSLLYHLHNGFDNLIAHNLPLRNYAYHHYWHQKFEIRALQTWMHHHMEKNWNKFFETHLLSTSQRGNPKKRKVACMIYTYII